RICSASCASASSSPARPLTPPPTRGKASTHWTPSSRRSTRSACCVNKSVRSAGSTASSPTAAPRRTSFPSSPPPRSTCGRPRRHGHPPARLRGGGRHAPGASGPSRRGQGHGHDHGRSARRRQPARSREAGFPARHGMSSLEQMKARVVEAVDGLADELERLSLQIHANPELCFKEEKAHGWLTEFLEKRGLRVE